MGLFLAVSAFRDCPVDDLATATVRYAARYGVACHAADGADEGARHDAFLFEPSGGWTLALWPGYFNLHDVALCQQLSRELDTIASTVHVYDGEYWVHALLDRGETVDRFASVPDYFAENEVAKTEMRERWAGNADVIARRLHVAADRLRPYLVHQSPEIEARRAKAYADDRFELSDLWVFTDFWRRLGIQYPDDVSHYATRLRFAEDYREKLPVASDDDL